jgi:anaerobic magnesium-protoporphyrin IX monomethyl ester cyclase
MVDILLINPSNITAQNTPMPFGIAYLASFLEKEGFSVKIIDLSVEKINNEGILKIIKEVKPKKIGLTCMSVHVSFVKELSKKIKEISDIPIILGGIHPTALPKKSLEYLPDVDLLVIGEGELTLPEIMKGKKLESIKGIAYRKGKKIQINKPREFIKNLDILPFPARHLLPNMNKYRLGFDWEGRVPSATIFSSRGCPYNCIYCASKVMWKQKVRFHSSERVLEEIDYLVKDHKIREILFYDDYFALDKPRLKRICDELIKRKYDLTWCCLSRVESIDFETAKLMKEAGCHMISFGVESGSQKILDNMEKGVKVETILKAFEVCKKVGINTKASFIFGGPGETSETIKETQGVIKKILSDYIWLFIMTPMPGTKLYQLHEESGMASEEWSMYDQTTYNKFYGTNLTYEELRKIVITTYKTYYLSPKYIISQLSKLNFRKLNTIAVLSKNVLTAVRYIKKGRQK